MTDHDRIEELLAGYVLGGLSGDDAAETDRILVDHVPGCVGCRGTLGAFQMVSSDLALATDPIEPPETLLPRLHRELEPRSRRSRSLAALTVAASVVAVIGLGGTFLQGARVGSAERRADAISNILRFAERNDAKMVPVGPATQVASDEEVFLFGEDVPSPPAGTVYVVWVRRGTTVDPLGWFLPENGWVLSHFTTGGPFDLLFVTIEAAQASPSAPGVVVWEQAS